MNKLLIFLYFTLLLFFACENKSNQVKKNPDKQIVQYDNKILDSSLISIDSKYILSVRKYETNNPKLGPIITILKLLKDSVFIWQDTINSLYVDEIKIENNDQFLTIEVWESPVSFHHFFIFDKLKKNIIITESFDGDYLFHKLKYKNDSLKVILLDLHDSSFVEFVKFRSVNYY